MVQLGNKSPLDTSAVKLPLGDGLWHDAVHLQWLDAGAAGGNRGWTRKPTACQSLNRRIMGVQGGKLVYL